MSTSGEGEKNNERQNNKNDEADNVQKEPTRKQKFKNLNQVMNENNYLDIPGQPKKVFRYQDTKKTIKIKWHPNSEDTKLQQCGSNNILKHTPGSRGPGKSVQTPLESFNLFFSKEMIDNIVKYTNQNIKPAMDRFADVFDKSDIYTHFCSVASNDILAYIGLLYLRGALNVNLQNTRDLWFHDLNDLFAATMLWNRFHFISKFITFDNKATRYDCWKYDKYACIRELFEMMN